MSGSPENNNDRSHSRVSLFGLPLDIGINALTVLECLQSGDMLLTYLNPYAYSIARSQTHYKQHLEQFDLVVCDGVGIKKAVRRFFRVETEILTPDTFGIAGDYLKFASEEGLSLCLVGGSPDVAQAACTRIEMENPGIQTLDAFDGYGESPDRARVHIKTHGPDMVLVGMGMGRQEAYLLSLRESGWSGIGICVGGFFDKLADPTLDYPEWSKRIGMRFVGRLVREPRRMIKRYFWDYRIFMWRYFLAMLGLRNRVK